MTTAQWLQSFLASRLPSEGRLPDGRPLYRYSCTVSEFGELTARGGGYLNPTTRAFLRAYIGRYRALPPEARRSWPWDFVHDLVSPGFDPWHDVPDDRPQLQLL